jgi:hypothetical protein
LKTRETVAGATPAFLATSIRVGLWLDFCDLIFPSFQNDNEIKYENQDNISQGIAHDNVA